MLDIFLIYMAMYLTNKSGNVWSSPSELFYLYCVLLPKIYSSTQDLLHRTRCFI